MEYDITGHIIILAYNRGLNLSLMIKYTKCSGGAGIPLEQLDKAVSDPSQGMGGAEGSFPGLTSSFYVISYVFWIDKYLSNLKS